MREGIERGLYESVLRAGRITERAVAQPTYRYVCSRIKECKEKSLEHSRIGMTT